MKRPLIFFALLLGLSAAATSMAASTMATINYRATFHSLPAEATGVIPGLFVYYADKSRQLFLTEQSATASFSLTQQVYIPTTATSIEPILAFVTANGSKYYWYCDDQINWTQQATQNVAFQSIPGKMSSAKQFFPCSYSQRATTKKTI